MYLRTKQDASSLTSAKTSRTSVQICFMGHVYEIQTISSGQFSGEGCVKKDFHSSVKH